MMHVVGSWSDEMTTLWHDLGPSVGVMFGGADGADMSFLDDLTGLRLLAASGNVSDDSAIGRSVSLRRIVVQTTAKGRLDWSALKNLSQADIHERDGLETLAELPALRTVVLWECMQSDFRILGRLEHLEVLRLKPCRRLRTFLGGRVQPRLQRLELNLCRAPLNLAELGQFPSLEYLEMDGCTRQGTLEGLENCLKLRELALNNCGSIENLQPLRECRELTILGLSGSTDISDGDIAALEDLPNLRQVLFDNRRHYNRREVDFANVD